MAQAGIAACRHLLARDPKSAAGHYYLAMDFGQLAEAEAPSIAAYKLVQEIEREFKAAAELDERFDYAGPPRCLGLLYRDAPGWPVSIGSKRKAREWLEHAAALAPEYPENQLNLAESQLRWHQPVEAEEDIEKTGRHLARRPDQSRRRSLGAELGRLDGAAGGGPVRIPKNLQACSRIVTIFRSCNNERMN